MDKKNIARTKLRILALTLSLALVFATVGSAYGAVSTKASQTQKTAASKAVTSETAKTTDKASTAETDEKAEATETSEKTEAAEKSEQTGETGGSGENGETEQEPEPEPAKIDISGLTVTLESYFESVTGKEITPRITSVSGKVTITVPVETETEDSDSAKSDETGNDKSSETEDAAVTDKTEKAENDSIKTTTVSKELSFQPEEYDIKYYRIHSYSEEEYEEVEKIISAGDYRIAITAKDAETYEGEAFCLFSVMGKPQKLTMAKTEYSLTFGDEAPTLTPKADGDGTGFAFYTSDSSVLTVSADGQTKILRPGRAIVTIYTAGTTLSQQAKVQVTFEIKPKKTLWNAAKMKKQASAGKLTWQKQTGVTSYEILYGTSKSFAKAKTKTKTVKGSPVKTTLKNLKKGKTYYVKIRALTETTDPREYKRTMTGAWSAVYKISVPKA